MSETPPPLLPYRSRWSRTARHAGGLLLVVTGIPLLVSPIPVAPAILLGLNLLKDDFRWANRVLTGLHTTTHQLRNRFPHSRLKLAQAALRRQLFMKRSWWPKKAAAPQAGAATPPGAPSASSPESKQTPP